VTELLRTRLSSPTLLFVLYGVLGAAPFVGAVAGLPYFPPLLFAAFRIDIGALILVVVVAVRGGYWLPRTRRDLAGVVVTGVLTLGGNIALVFIGQQYVTSATGAVVYSLAPVITAALASILIPAERLNVVGACGVLLGFLGAAIVANPSPTTLTGGTTRGAALVFLSATSFALGNVVTRRLSPTMPGLPLTAWGLVVASVVVHAVSTLSGEAVGQVEWSVQGILALVGVGVLATAVLYSVHFELLGAIGATKTTLAYYVHPVSTAIAGHILLAERITTPTLVGLPVICTGFLLVEWRTVAAISERYR
jgi:drug/metabolite transporter (DMT)-like permease